MLLNFKEFRCFGSGGKEFFRRRGSADGLFLGGMMRRRIVPCLFFIAVFFAPLLVSADSDVAVRERAAGFVGDAFDESLRYARDKYVLGDESAVDFSEWLARHGELTFNEVVVSPLLRGGESYVEGLGFVRDVEVRYESPLGERAGNFGVAALGSLRETADDVVAWELRGFVGEDDVAGANVGAAYRRLLADDFLVGVNAFLDYERGGDDLADESFWRWSAGVEATGRHLDFSANRYWAISDAVMATVGGTAYRVYSADGWDAELRGRLPLRYPVAFRFLDSAEVAARYYVWEGDGDGTGGGDADVSGARYRFGFVPLPQLRFGVEYDDGDGGGKNFGYYVNFRHRLGAASESVLRDDGADVWSRRFDPVRREHQQHIMRTQAGAGVVTSVEIYLSTVSVGAEMVTLVPINLSASYSYAVASANPLALANSVTVDSGGVVSYAGIVAGGVGGNVVFELTPVAGGAAVSVSVFFRDLAIPDNPNFNSAGELPILLSEFAVSATLFTVTADGALSQKFAIVESRSAAWANLLAIDEDSGEVTDAGLVGAARNGVVVFSVTDADDAVVFLTVRFGGLSFADVSLTVHSLQTSATVTTLMASGGSGAVVYEAVSFNPIAASVSLMVVGDKLIDNGLAAGGAATATVTVEATDAAGFEATAAMVVEVLDDVSIVGSVDVVITPGNENGPVYTLAAMGGDGNYTYAWVFANPSDWQDSTLVITGSVVSGVDAAAGGAVSATAVFSATDGIGAMTVLVTAYIEVVESATFVSDNFNLTLTSDDSGEVLTLSVVVGDGTHSFAVHSTDSFSALFMIAEGANGHGIITDNGAIAAGADSGEVVFSLTDNSVVGFATVHIVVYDDIIFTADEVTVTINSADAGDNIQTITAMGGDGSYIYALDTIMPASFSDSLAINNIGGEGVISDSGAATQGPLTVSAVYSATDGLGDVAMASVEVVILADVGFVADDLTVTVASTDSGAMVLTLTATGGDGSYTFTFDSANPSGSEVSLSTAGSGAEFVITDNGIAAGGAVTATFEYKVTDGSGLEATATVEVIAVADLAIVISSVSLALTFADAGAEVVTLSVTGGAAPLTYAVVSTNPSGRGDLLAVDSNGVISEAGVVTVGGFGTVVFSITDALNRVVNATVEFNYTAVKFSARRFHSAAVLGNKMYVIGGLDASGRLSDVWSSADGVNWTMESTGAFPARVLHSSAVLGGSLYVIGGVDAGNTRLNDVWRSADGANWVQVTAAAAFPVRYAHESVVLGVSLYVIGGADSGSTRYNDVWASDDGETWVQVTAAAAFPSRYSHSAAVLGGTMYVIGGQSTGTNYFNDMWASDDGANWTQVTSPAGFAARIYHASPVLGNKLYVINGRNDGGTSINDIWSSVNGAALTRETAAADFSARESFASAVLNGRIYVLSGYSSGSGSDLDEIWSSADGINWTQH